IYWMRSTSYQVFGPFVNHNQFAGYMIMLMATPLALVLKVVKGPARLAYGFAATLMAVSVIISGARSGTISLVLAIVFMAILNKRYDAFGRVEERLEPERSRLSRIGPIVIVAAVIIVGVVWIGAVPIIERFGVAIDHVVRSGTPDPSRAMIWR